MKNVRSSIRAATITVLVLASACASPVGVRRAGPEEVYRTLTANVLSTQTLSAPSSQLLYRLDLTERAAEDPEEVLAELHDRLGGIYHQDLLYCMAELSFAYAITREKPAYALAAAVYANAFLSPTDPEDVPAGYDPRLRVAVDLYNRGIVEGLATEDGKFVDVSSRSFTLPFGTLELETPERDMVHYGYRLHDFVAASDLMVHGLRNRYRRPGIGAPLIAEIEPVDGGKRNPWDSLDSNFPVTAMLFLPHLRFDGDEENIRATLRLYEDDAEATVELADRTLPLERETTAALAYRLDGAAVWDFEFAGFRRGDFRLNDENELGLFMLQPYRRGRIPVVFVHGTASSPARWAEMSNELMSDPMIGTRYQFWYFIYNTGNPVSLSASRLRKALRTVVESVDPDRTDEALGQMVLIGHSQGGLLVKLQVVDSEDRFWRLISDKPIDSIELSEDTRAVLSEASFFEALPFVRRVIFIATPHGGSFVAGNWIGRLSRRLIHLPGKIARVGVELARLDPKGAAEESVKAPTSVDNMRPGDPFLVTLRKTEIDEEVEVHSIIAVKPGMDPVEEGNDGVVEYEAAHIENVRSELVVRSGHSTQSVPATIEEVRRILHEDLRMSRRAD